MITLSVISLSGVHCISKVNTINLTIIHLNSVVVVGSSTLIDKWKNSWLKDFTLFSDF